MLKVFVSLPNRAEKCIKGLKGLVLVKNIKENYPLIL